MIAVKTLINAAKARLSSSDSKRNVPVTFCPAIHRPVNFFSLTRPRHGVELPRLRRAKSLFEQQRELEEYLMLNPLTRGKGFKPVKMMRRLLGISSFMHAVDPVTSGGYPRELVLGSPERGLAHTIVHRAPRYGERQRNWELSYSFSVSESQRLTLSGILQLLLYSLGTGCLIYWVGLLSLF